jgi:hypothetical protein
LELGKIRAGCLRTGGGVNFESGGGVRAQRGLGSRAVTGCKRPESGCRFEVSTRSRHGSSKFQQTKTLIEKSGNSLIVALIPVQCSAFKIDGAGEDREGVSSDSNQVRYFPCLNSMPMPYVVSFAKVACPARMPSAPRAYLVVVISCVRYFFFHFRLYVL